MGQTKKKKIENKIKVPMYASKQYIHLCTLSPNNTSNKVAGP